MENSQVVGHVNALFRYPVKSMQGESVPEVELDSLGVQGDRHYALRMADGRIATAKRTTGLLDYRAHHDGDTVWIETPDGETFNVDDPALNDHLSKALGMKVSLEQREPHKKHFGELDTRTLFGGLPTADVLRGKARQLPEDATQYGLFPGTFCDSSPLHLLTTATLEHLHRLMDGRATLHVRRFRPNILIESTPEAHGFAEDEWLGGKLHIGDVSLDDLWPTLRCVVTTLPQQDLPKEPPILKAIVKEHDNHLGVFARASRGGRIQTGDPIHWTPKDMEPKPTT